MTTIAYDGYTLAADRMADGGGMARSVSKLYPVPGGWVAISGRLCVGLEVLEWIRAGRNPATFPAAQRGEDPAYVLLIEADGVPRLFEGGPFPLEFQDRLFAMGSGREYALAAMDLGRSPAEAVRLAAKYDPYTNEVVDEVRIVRTGTDKPSQP